MDATFELQPVPRSQATNAYDLLEDVIKAIEEEPKRYNQSEWFYQARLLTTSSRQLMPACGTVACVAGWTAVLVDGTSSNGTADIRAMELLGLMLEQGGELFTGAAVVDQWRRERGEEVFLYNKFPYNPGDKEYAALGVRHIRNFMARHEVQLRAKAVP